MNAPLAAPTPLTRHNSKLPRQERRTVAANEALYEQAEGP